MDLPSLIRLRELVHSPNYEIKLPINEILEDDLVCTGVVQFYYNGTQNVEKIPVDLAMKIIPIIDKFIEEVEKSRNTEIATVVSGLINLFGIITLKNITQIYKRIDKKITIEDIRTVVMQSYSLNNMYHKNFVKLDECMISAHIVCVGQTLEELKRAKGRQFNNFNKEEIINMSGFSPIPPYHRMKELHQLFANLGYEQQMIMRIITILWSINNNCIEHESGVDILYHYICGTYKKVNKDYYIELVNDYINRIPKWTLKGNSLIQMANYFSSKNMIKKDLKNDNASYYAQVIKAVTNSDNGSLCPCGSGKKFKACCGNN